jgi:hypothetical protein
LVRNGALLFLRRYKTGHHHYLLALYKMANFSYVLTSLNTNVCDKIITPGQTVSLSWSINGDPGFDKCYVAVRPVSDLHDDGAIVAGMFLMIPKVEHASLK